MNLLSYNNPFGRFLHLVGDLVVLHLLWLLCSVPLITIGAANTALYYASMKRIRTDEGQITRNFFSSFRRNFRQSTIEWILILAFGFLFYLDLRIGMATEGLLGRVMVAGCSVFLIPYILVTLYIFPVQAKFENRVIDNFKNALLMSIQSFPLSLVLLLINGTFVALTLFFRPFIGLLICCGAGLYGYICGGIFVTVFRKYLPNEIEEDKDPRDSEDEG